MSTSRKNDLPSGYELDATAYKPGTQFVGGVPLSSIHERFHLKISIDFRERIGLVLELIGLHRDQIDAVMDYRIRREVLEAVDRILTEIICKEEEGANVKVYFYETLASGEDLHRTTKTATGWTIELRTFRRY